jgi:hypothetical protein
MNRSNNALLGKVSDKIDDFATNARPEDVLMGDPAAGSAALQQARALWGRGSKLERVDQLLGRAELNAGSTGSGGNIENATRQQMKRLLTNPAMTRGMTKDEIAATRKAVLGSKGQNALRLAGKLSPQGNGLMAMLNLVHMTTNPGLGVPVAAAGFGAKRAAEAMTSRNVEVLRSLIASGGKKTVPGAKSAAITDQTMALIRALLMGGATQISQN